jgi:uracil-DNA glycosylase family 4
MMLNCQRCHLAQYRSHIVFGRGNLLSARILLIGEAPGLSEDVLGKAFIGESGKLLDEILLRSNIALEECFFTNTVLCRPCNFRGDRETRPPTKNEVFACLQNVMSLISGAKKIEYVVFVGRISESYYKNRLKSIVSKTIVHPSAMLKNGGKSSPLFLDAINGLKNAIKNAQRSTSSIGEREGRLAYYGGSNPDDF